MVGFGSIFLIYASACVKRQLPTHFRVGTELETVIRTSKGTQGPDSGSEDYRRDKLYQKGTDIRILLYVAARFGSVKEGLRKAASGRVKSVRNGARVTKIIN